MGAHPHARKEESMSVGLDSDTLEMVLDAIGMFAEGELSEARLLELDAADEFPEDVVRGMCGEQLGISLLFIPEDYGGMGGGVVRRLPRAAS